MPRTIDNSEDILDSRDIIERIEELESELDDAYNAEGDHSRTFRIWLTEAAENDEHTLQDAAGELANLLNLQDEAEGYSDDWKYGATLIRDSYFQEYAQELADDIGATDRKATWPLNCIDWEQAARELQMDYTSVEFDGVTYWVR